MSHYNGRDFDGIFDKLIHDLLKNPDFVCSPRGSKIHEQIGTQLVLHNPRARLLANEPRAANYGFGVGEFLWYYQGKRDLETMKYYNKRMKSFSKDGRTLNSAYGYRLRREKVYVPGVHGDCFSEPPTQWDICMQTLNQDPDSRRAVMHINQPYDQRNAAHFGSPDVPCTLSLQFFIRDNKLHLIVNMRSNDIMWGLTYDLFSFTLLQEVMLLDLKRNYPDKFKDLGLGKYIHNAGSMHLYEQHFEQAAKIFDWQGRPAKPMDELDLEQLDNLIVYEEALRTDATVPMSPDGRFWGAAHWMAGELNKHKEKRNAERV
jgi:thymidylate synthase